MQKNSAAEEIDIVRRAVFVPRLSVHLRMRFVAGKRALSRCAETSFFSTALQSYGNFHALPNFGLRIGPIFSTNWGDFLQVSYTEMVESVA